MNFLPKHLNLLVAASSTKRLRVRNEFGDWTHKGVATAAINALKRPPFIPSAPLSKRDWTPQEIAEFYQRNPQF